MHTQRTGAALTLHLDGPALEDIRVQTLAAMQGPAELLASCAAPAEDQEDEEQVAAIRAEVEPLLATHVAILAAVGWPDGRPTPEEAELPAGAVAAVLEQADEEIARADEAIEEWESWQRTGRVGPEDGVVVERERRRRAIRIKRAIEAATAALAGEIVPAGI
jgi:hypothetical protein